MYMDKDTGTVFRLSQHTHRFCNASATIHQTTLDQINNLSKLMPLHRKQSLSKQNKINAKQSHQKAICQKMT